MIKSTRLAKQVEFGDFQTPIELADKVTEVLAASGLKPNAVLEPTCGKGSFLEAVVKRYRKVEYLGGVDINPLYVAEAKKRLDNQNHIKKVVIETGISLISIGEIYSTISPPQFW